jgi:hypothetical protein
VWQLHIFAAYVRTSTNADWVKKLSTNSGTHGGNCTAAEYSTLDQPLSRKY